MVPGKGAHAARMDGVPGFNLGIAGIWGGVRQVEAQTLFPFQIIFLKEIIKQQTDILIE